MSGGMGGGGLGDVSAIPSDLEAIYQGGVFFLDRMKAIENAKLASDNALAALNVGNDIVAAKTAAVASAFAAAADQAQAAKTLDEAKAHAAQIMAQARSQAMQTEMQAAQAGRIADDYVVSTRTAADAYASDVRAKADAVLAEANARQDDVPARIAAATAAETRFNAAKATQEDMTKAASDMKAAYLKKLRALQDVIADE